MSPGACQMADAVQLNGAVFDPAATHVMGEAFDCACRSLRGIGQVDSVREIIAYRSGRCRGWIKVKNPASPAVLRIQDGTW